MYKFLLIEDSESDIAACQDTVERMNLEVGELRIKIEIANTFELGIEKLRNSYNGVIVDIRLKGAKTGNEILQMIINTYRIPVAVMTGTPDTILSVGSPIVIYKKGEHTYEEIIKELIKSYQTGLFDVLGGKGKIESAINRVFWKNLYPQIHIWENLKEAGTDTEKILLRYAIAHIQELLDVEIPAYVTEEMYIKPPLDSAIRTGSIIRNKKDGLYCIVLSPPCDLVIHNGAIKTDRVMLCEIDNQQAVCLQVIGTANSEDKKIKCLIPAVKNNYTEYYHWLPNNDLFEGGYINFRKVLTYSPEDLAKQFDKPEIHIQDYFVKDILSRFSTYYARQGQPDFDFEKEARRIVEDCL